jgi:hypothetical protein
MEKSHRPGLFPRMLAAAPVVVVAAVIAACSTASPPEPVATTSSALAITGLFATGVNAAGMPLANGTVDPHYVLSSNDPNFPGPNAVAVAANAAWTGNTAASKWISIRASAMGGTNDTYTYTTTFTLAAVDPSTATLSGTWAADDSVVLMLNGTQVAAYPAEAYGALAAFTVPASGTFVLGTNTLAFVTLNSGGGPTGLQVATISGSVSGCTVDSECTAAQFCDTQTFVCISKLSNGSGIPTITGHTPPLTGVCSAAVGTAVCLSGVCDTKDNECGYANGDGPCTPGAGGNGGTVCRSTACSVTDVCMPLGGCDVDADCTGGDWCDESTNTCTPQLANGQAIPTDAPHTNPTLDGMCTAGAGALVCVSGVCDTTDNECGYANGDGPCTPGAGGNGGTVCRSTACSVSGVCEPLGGCEVDADCSGGDWCDESTTTCTPPLANGQTIPIDPPHANPTLNGMCTAGAGALVCVSGVCDAKNSECGYANGDGPCNATDGGASVCQSGVCDKDGNCGYANGDGPCTQGNEGVVCRSGTCSLSGTCEPAGGCATDADCTGGKWCDETSGTCTAKLANGQPVPTDPPHTNPTLNGMCTVGAASLVCISGVCDTNDNECGYADGDGPCNAGTGGTVCRSTACSMNGTCEPMGGCNIDADCTNPASPDCNQTTHMCQGVPDGGVEAGKEGGTVEAGSEGGSEGGTVTDGGGADGAPSEAGAESGGPADASGGADASVDAASAGDASNEPGYLEGGGLSCGVTNAVGAGEAGGVSALSLLGLLAMGRRRARASGR